MKAGELKSALNSIDDDADIKVVYKDNGVSNVTDNISLYKNLIGNELEIRGCK